MDINDILPSVVAVIAGAGILHAFYWGLLRPHLLDKIEYALKELRDQMIQAHLERKEGYNSKAFTIVYSSLNDIEDMSPVSFFYSIYLSVFSKSAVAQYEHKSEIISESEAWIATIEHKRNFQMLLAAIFNSPLVLCIAAPMVILAVSQTVTKRIYAGMMLAENDARSHRNCGHDGMAHA